MRNIALGKLAAMWGVSFVLSTLTMAGGHSLAMVGNPLTRMEGILVALGGDWGALLWLPILALFGGGVAGTITLAKIGKTAAAAAIAAISLLLAFGLGALGWLPGLGTGSLLFLLAASTLLTGGAWLLTSARFTE